jgi:hypothetical protein
MKLSAVLLLLRLAFCILLMLLSLQHNLALADTPATLSAIADTADRICGIVATQGEAGQSKVQGDIHAELNGLARRLATIGGSASTDFTSSKYQGLLQQDLPTALKDTRECKLQVFEKLQAIILPGTNPAPVPNGLTQDLIQAPSNAQAVDMTKSISRTEELGLYSCANGTNVITCYIVMTKISPGPQDYAIERMNINQLKLVDNFHIEHRLKRAYFIDGIGTQRQTTNLSAGESIWVVFEFESTTRPISSARIVLAPSQGAPQLSGPVS